MVDNMKPNIKLVKENYTKLKRRGKGSLLYKL